MTPTRQVGRPSRGLVSFSLDRFKRRLKSRGLTPHGLERTLRKHGIRARIPGLLAGDGDPSYQLLFAIAHCLGCRMEDLLEEVPRQQPVSPRRLPSIWRRIAPDVRAVYAAVRSHHDAGVEHWINARDVGEEATAATGVEILPTQHASWALPRLRALAEFGLVHQDWSTRLWRLAYAGERVEVYERAGRWATRVHIGESTDSEDAA